MQTIAQMNQEVQALFIENNQNHQDLREEQVQRQIEQEDFKMRQSLTKRLVK